jgi:pimeloyl-ACP methyl ester carboxylesterase
MGDIFFREYALVFGFLICVMVVAALFFVHPVLTGLGRLLVVNDTRARLQRANLDTRYVELPSGVVAWYLEASGDSARLAPPLIVLPGATADMAYIGARVSALVQFFPDRRVVVVELPYHGQNTVKDFDFGNPEPSMKGMVSYLEELADALAFTEPFDLMGYSLGGGIASIFAAEHPQRIHRLILLTPFLFEVATDAFQSTVNRRQWRSIHGWESFEEMLSFFRAWLGLNEMNALPRFILRGAYKLRADRYESGYWSAFFEKLDSPANPDRTLLADQEAWLEGIQKPVLLLAGRTDAVCDQEKLTRLRDAFGKKFCKFKVIECGHAFAPKRGDTCFDVALHDIKEFLSGVDSEKTHG